MNGWQQICKLDDIPRLGSRVVASPQGDIAIFRTADDRVFGLNDKCPHKGGPLSQAAAKDLIRAVDNQPINDAVVEDTAQRIAQLRATPEAQDGLSAFLDKRQPGWLA